MWVGLELSLNELVVHSTAGSFAICNTVSLMEEKMSTKARNFYWLSMSGIDFESIRSFDKRFLFYDYSW